MERCFGYKRSLYLILRVKNYPGEAEHENFNRKHTRYE